MVPLELGRTQPSQLYTVALTIIWKKITCKKVLQEIQSIPIEFWTMTSFIQRKGGFSKNVAPNFSGQ